MENEEENNDFTGGSLSQDTTRNVTSVSSSGSYTGDKSEFNMTLDREENEQSDR